MQTTNGSMQTTNGSIKTTNGVKLLTSIIFITYVIIIAILLKFYIKSNENTISKLYCNECKTAKSIEEYIDNKKCKTCGKDLSTTGVFKLLNCKECGLKLKSNESTCNKCGNTWTEFSEQEVLKELKFDTLESYIEHTRDVNEKQMQLMLKTMFILVILTIFIIILVNLVNSKKVKISKHN